MCKPIPGRGGLKMSAWKICGSNLLSIASNPKDENHSWFAITMENAADAWVRRVTFEHFAGSAVAIYESCKCVTVEDCHSLAPVSEDGGWRRNTFFTMGQQTLFLRCFAEHGRHDFSVGNCAAGPNAFVQCESILPAADSGAIESWASGTLFDNVRIDGGGLSLMNRGGDDGRRGLVGGELRFMELCRVKNFLRKSAGRTKLGIRFVGRIFRQRHLAQFK